MFVIVCITAFSHNRCTVILVLDIMSIYLNSYTILYRNTFSSDEPKAAEKTSVEGIVRRRALYQFDARNHDELSFMPGDIITVSC